MQFIKKSTSYVIATFFALYVGFLYAINIDNSLTTQGALIGIATFDGIDVGSRIQHFYFMIFLSGLTFKLSNWLLKKRAKSTPHEWSLPIAAIGIMTLIIRFYNPDYSYISGFILLLLLSTFIRIKNENHRLFFTLLAVGVTIFISFLLRISGTEIAIVFIVFIWALVLLILFVLDANTEMGQHAKKLYPLLLLPLLEPLGTETFMVLNQRSIFLTTSIGWVLLFFILLLGWTIFRFNKNQKATPLQDSKFIYLFVLSVATFSIYQPFYSYWGDLFELANPANAMMRHFVFGEIPFIDYFSSHVLFEQFPQWIYVLLNGYHADVSFMVYAFIAKVIGIVISFWFFKQILKTEWALLIVFLFPFTDALIPPTFVMGLVTIKLLFDYFKIRKPKQLYYLLGWILAITLWRIDFGASIIPAITLIFLLEWLQSRNWKEIKTVFFHVGIFTAIILGISFLGNLSSEGKLFENLPLALDYLGASQAHAYTEITKKFTLLFYLHYYVFPLVSVILLIQIWTSKWKQKSLYSFVEISTIFLGLFYLFNAQRGLVRHSFSEEYDLYISSVFFLFIATWSLRFYTKNRGLIFTMLSFILILGFHYSNHGKPQSFGVKTLSSTLSAKGVQNTVKRINRVRITHDFDAEGYDQLSEFINANLKPNETFIDFSHAPMLYFFTQRKVPSYFNQYIQNTVTPKLLKHNASKLNNIGLVVFGHSPRNPIDVLDGVPNELRYLPVTEYIFNNFTPFTTVNGYRIWMPSDANKTVTDSLAMYPEMRDDLRKWPSYLAISNSFTKSEEIIMSGNEVLLFEHTPNIHDAFNIEFDSIPEEASHTAWFQYFDTANRLIGEIEFEIMGLNSQRSFVVPIGYQYNWHSIPISKIKFIYPDYLTLNSINMVAYEP